MKRLSRREFFRTTGFVALGAFAAACTKKLKITAGTTLASLTSGHQQTLQMITAGIEILPDVQDRLVFGLIVPSDGSAITLPTVPIWIARDQHSPVTSLTATYRVEGLPPANGFYEAPIKLASGTWQVETVFKRPGRSVEDLAAAQFAVGRQTAMPKPGDRAVIVPTPTYKDHRGVNPICTRNPPCSMHVISLDAALKSGKPTVLIISTPKFCQSRQCGPTTDVVQSVSKGFGGRVNFVHVEVYKDAKPTTIQRQLTSPAATAWHLDQEPAIYYIDKSGIIQSRTIGPADKAEVQAAATTLAG